MKLDLRNPDIQVAIFAVVFVLGVIGAIIHYLRIDNDLKNAETFGQIQMLFESEFKSIKLPLKTAVNKTENLSKLGVAVSLKYRYRSELAQDEFIKSFKNELEKDGWVYYGNENEHPFVMTEVFCKGKYDAQLSKESKNIWSDDADYYQLNFSFGNRDFITLNKTLPESCK